MGLIFQGFNLFPHLSVGRNVMLAPTLVKKRDTAAATGQARTLLALEPAELRFARKVSDRLVFMRAGRIHEIGPPEQIFSNPQTPKLRQFLSSIDAMAAQAAGRWLQPLPLPGSARRYCPPVRLRLISISRAHSGWSRKRGFSHSRSMHKAIAMNTREPQASRALDGAAPVGNGSWRAGGGASRPVIMPSGMTSSMAPSLPAAVALSSTRAGTGRSLSRATALAEAVVPLAAMAALALPSGRAALAPSVATAAAGGAPPLAGKPGAVDTTADAAIGTAGTAAAATAGAALAPVTAARGAAVEAARAAANAALALLAA